MLGLSVDYVEHGVGTIVSFVSNDVDFVFEDEKHHAGQKYVLKSAKEQPSTANPLSNYSISTCAIKPLYIVTQY